MSTQTPPPKKAPGPVPLALLPQLVAGILRLARAGTRKGNRSTLRDGLAILLGLHGLRIREISNLAVKDLRPSRVALWVRTLKGGRNRLVPLSPTAWQLAQDLAATASSVDDPLCRTKSSRAINTRDLRRRWSTWCAKILGQHYRFHDLRHTAARVLSSKEGAGILAAQDLLGHRKLDTTRRYVVDGDAVRSAIADAFEPPTTHEAHPPTRTPGTADPR